MRKIIATILLVPTLIQALVDDGLPNLQPSSSFYEQQRSLVCMAQAFTSAESAKVFGIDFIKNNIRPLMLMFENRGTASFTVMAPNVELLPAKRIIDELQYNTAAFATATGMPALFYCWEMCLPIATIAYEFYRHNRWAEELIDGNIMQKSTNIGPLQTVKRLIFVPEDSGFNQFSVAVFDNRNGDSFIFEVDLAARLKRHLI